MKVFFLTSGGLGFLRPASGTWGSTPPAGVAWLLLLLGAPAPVLAGALSLLFLISAAACIAWGAYAEERFGVKDPREVVADETAGMVVTLTPLLFFTDGLGTDFWRITAAVGAAFVLFRVSDIIKPPPARGLERLSAGWGILVDDLIAGVYAAIPLIVLLPLLPTVS